jgi:hypothetical protein
MVQGGHEPNVREGGKGTGCSEGKVAINNEELRAAMARLDAQALALDAQAAGASKGSAPRCALAVREATRSRIHN